MKIIIAPTKRMHIDADSLPPLSVPVYQKQAKEIISYMHTLNKTELQKIWKTSQKLTEKAYRELSDFAFSKLDTPALFAYEGLVFNYMSPHVMDTNSYRYLQEHLFIISGLFGVLKPFDGIMPYRLEMGAKLPINDTHSLYDFWGDLIYKEVMKDDHILLNLASFEYAKCLYDYQQDGDQIIDVIFGEYRNDKLITKATHAKIGRGLMISYLADHQVKRIEDLYDFNEYGFVFHEELSDESRLVFVKA